MRPEDGLCILAVAGEIEHQPSPLVRFLAPPCPVEIRIPARERYFEPAEGARRNYWVRVSPPPCSIDAEAHKVLFGYLSDLLLSGVPLVPHTLPMPGPHLRSLSLDHAIWFHAPVDCSRWILFETECHVAANGCNLAQGRAYDEDGTLVATVQQEVLQSLGD